MTKEVKNIPTDEEVLAALEVIKSACHGRAWNAGWWHDPVTGEQLKNRSVPEMLMLMVSEIGEAMEGHRKGLMDDKLPGYAMFDVEIWDLIIRAFDLVGGLGVPTLAFVDKMHFNDDRADHKVENRIKEGGKAY